MTCKTCKHWHDKGVCKRYPPRTIPVSITLWRENVYSVDNQKEVIYTEADDTCGEWSISDKELRKRLKES